MPVDDRINYRGRMKPENFARMLGLNCDPKLGVDKRCPYCGQFHLRPGFCQAVHDPSLRVDKVSTELSTHGQNVQAKVSTLSTPLTEPVIEPDEEVEDTAAKRRAYKAKHERDRRAAKKSKRE